jgi:hypothetical protein
MLSDRLNNLTVVSVVRFYASLRAIKASRDLIMPRYTGRGVSDASVSADRAEPSE